MFEVELKAYLDIPREDFIAQAKELGYVFAEELRERDSYFAVMVDGRAREDRILRVRRQLAGGHVFAFLAYKGPRESGKSQAREELELEVGGAETAEALLEALGHRAVAVVEKRRESYRKGEVTLAVDQVEGLGEFIELELLVAGRDEIPAAEAELHRRLQRLLPRPRVEESTYLQLLLKAGQG